QRLDDTLVVRTQLRAVPATADGIDQVGARHQPLALDVEGGDLTAEARGLRREHAGVVGDSRLVLVERQRLRLLGVGYGLSLLRVFGLQVIERRQIVLDLLEGGQY